MNTRVRDCQRMRTAEPCFRSSNLEFYAETSTGAEANVCGCVLRSRLKFADEVHFSACAFNLSQDLVVGESGCRFVSVCAERHAIGQYAVAMSGDESRFEDVRAFEIASRGGENVCRMKSPVTSDVQVEERREERRTIEPWPAEPIDGSVASDESGRTTVADDSVIVDWAIPSIVHPFSSMQREARMRAGEMNGST